MIIDNHKICFITCVTDEIFYNESLLYLQELYVPEGLQVEFIAVRNAKSMASGYNKAMQQSNAKYKVYLHQDVFIINKNYIKEILKLFEKEEQISLIGLAGCKNLSSAGIWWQEKDLYGRVCHANTPESIQKTYYGEIEGDYKDVIAVDGLLMATQYDLYWRDDILSGWHFYDIAQSFEFHRKGYKVVIPQQIDFWVVHASGDKQLNEKYALAKKAFLAEYSKEMAALPEVNSGLR